jgi:hypothetical protein
MSILWSFDALGEKNLPDPMDPEILGRIRAKKSAAYPRLLNSALRPDDDPKRQPSIAPCQQRNSLDVLL